MQTLTYDINIDLSNIYTENPIYVKQGSKNSQILNIHIFNNGESYQIEDSVTVRIKASKPDLTQVFNDCTFSNNVITVTLTEQMLIAPGNLSCEISLYDSEMILNTFSFNITVLPSVLDPHKVVSSDEFYALNNALEKVVSIDEIVSEAKKASDSADSSATTAQNALTELELIVNDLDNTVINIIETKSNVPNGIAGLDENGKLVNMPTAEDIGALTEDDLKNNLDDTVINIIETKSNVPNGIAGLDENGKLVNMPTADDVGALTEDDLKNNLDDTIVNIIETKSNVPNGIAGLDENGKLVNMPTAEDIGALTEDDLKIEKITLNGVEITPDKNKIVNINATTTQQGESFENHIENSTIHVTAEEKNNFNSSYVHSKTGTIHYLENSNGTNNIIFKATDDYLYNDTFVVNGEEVVAKLQNGNNLINNYFVTGSTVTAILDEGQLNFKFAGGGGGLELPSPAFGTKWSQLTMNSVNGVAIDSNNDVYCAGETGMLWKSSGVDGSILWQKSLGDVRVTAATWGVDGYLYVGDSDKKIRKFSQDGEQVLSFATSHTGTIDSIAVHTNGNIATGSNDYKVKLFDSTGAVKYTSTASSSVIYKVLFDKDGYVYTASYGGHVRKLNSSGSAAWTQTIGGHIYDIAMDSEENIYGVSSNLDYLSKISKSGTIIWNSAGDITIDQTVESIVIDSQDNIYLGTQNGDLYKITKDRQLIYKKHLFDDHLDYLNIGSNEQVYGYVRGGINGVNQNLVMLQENLDANQLLNNLGEINSCEVREYNSNYMVVKLYK